MITEPIPNIYQDHFLRLTDNGELVADSILKLMHRYLDGKPTKAGNRNLSAAERDLDFWVADFWDDVSAEVFETETFALVLARYLQQNKVTRSGWLQYLVCEAPTALRRAIRYSQVFLFPTELHWKEIKSLNIDQGLSEFINACNIIQSEHRKLENAIKSIEAELKRLTPMEILIYASLYAFQHLVLKLGQQELRPHLIEEHKARKSRNDFQRITDAINQILISKLKTSSDNDFFISERIIGESLRKHMASLLFPSRNTTRAAERCISRLKTFSRLVDAYLCFDQLVSGTLSNFCFDEDYDIRFEGERLIVFPRVIPEESEWDRNGRKLDRLHQYWHFKAIDEFIKLGLAFKSFGSPENEETNRFAWLSAIRTKLELAEIYGLDDEITIENGNKIDLLQALLTIELMHGFYKHCYILPYCKKHEQTGNWLTALTEFSFMGLVEGENRFPITFAERKAKIARICCWTVNKDWPNGNKQLTEAILDFWSNDLKDSSRRLRQNEHALQPKLHERPIFKIGNYLFELPWVFAFQNNVTAAVNNLRRIGRNRGELNIETNRIEKRLAETFEQFGFNVVGNFHPPLNADYEVGEIDLICFRDDHLFIFEIKSGYIRKTQRDAWQHRTNTLRKAALQLKRKSALVAERLKTDPILSTLLSDRDSNHIQTHCWIIDTSIEHDHEYFEGFLKISLQETIIALRNERHLLRDMHQAMTNEKLKRNGDHLNESDFEDIFGAAMIAIGEQSPEDNLYPNGFTADQFADVIEKGLIWEVLN